MSEQDLPPRMPPPIPQTPVIRPMSMKVPRVFNVWGTIVYVVTSITTLAFMIAEPWWTPPWWVLLPTYAYVFVSASIIAMGRIESNKDARAYVEMIKRQSDLNKRSMN